MNNIINLSERKEVILQKKKLLKEQMDIENKKQELISDMETIVYLISKGEISTIDMICTFREKDCYYGYRESIESEDIKERVDNIYKQIKFE